MRILLLSVLFLSCSIDNARKHFLLAERLWNDQKYHAAVVEFQKVAQKDKGELGIQAIYRAAMTEYLFLSQAPQALQKFKLVAERSSDPKLAWEARLKIGELLFDATQQYPEAVEHYEELLKNYPKAAQKEEFQYKIGRGYFLMSEFNLAIDQFKTFSHQSSTEWAEKAHFDLALTYFTKGDHLLAEKSYLDFQQRFPQSKKVVEAAYGLAGCFEETNRLEKALEVLQGIQSQHPSPELVRFRIDRIKQRMQQKKIL